MKTLSLLFTILFFIFIATAVAATASDLPESVQKLIDQNSMLARRIIESPYLFERRSTDLLRGDKEARVEHDISVYALSELWTSTSTVYYARNESGSVDFNEILRSETASSHFDLQTRIRRGWRARQTGGLVSNEECTDPCTCQYMGSIKLSDREIFHPRLREFGLLFPSKTNNKVTNKSLSLVDSLAEATDVKYLGREQFEGQWCEVISFDLFGRQKFWLDETRNGMVLCIEVETDGRPFVRAVFKGGHEVFPGLFIPEERRNYNLSYDEESGSEIAVLEYEMELIKLSFNPEDWPNITENDFGFRFMPNSLVHDLRLPKKPLYVIGDSINDVQFTFHRSDEYIRWCDERTGKDPSTSAPLLNKASSSEAGLSVYILVAIGLVIAVSVGAAIFGLRNLQGKGGR